MALITDRFEGEPLLKLGRLNHGTVHVRDIAKTRRFYEQVLGLEVIQPSPASLMIRKGTEHVYAVVEAPDTGQDMHLLFHNGFEVDSAEEVLAAYELVLSIKDEWGLKRVNKPRITHGDYQFYFMDFDGNWWEIVETRKGGYVADFYDKKHWDLTGRHDLDGLAAQFPQVIAHTHDAETRKLLDDSPASAE